MSIRSSDPRNNTKREHLVRQQHAPGRQSQQLIIDLDQPRVSKPAQVRGVFRLQVPAKARAVRAQIKSAHHPQAEEDRFGAGFIVAQSGGLDHRRLPALDQVDIAGRVALVAPAAALAVE